MKLEASKEIYKYKRGTSFSSYYYQTYVKCIKAKCYKSVQLLLIRLHFIDLVFN